MLQAYEEIIKIQPRGVITLPKKLRTKVGLADNSFVRLKEEKGRIVMEPVVVLPYPVRTYSDNEVEEFFELDEKEAKNLKKKKLL